MTLRLSSATLIATTLLDDTCVTSVDLGESQRGMLDYVLHVKVQPKAEANLLNVQCDSLLIDGSANQRLPQLPAEWSLVWSGKRSFGAREQFWLYTRNHPDFDATEIASRRHYFKNKKGSHGFMRRKV